MLSYQHAYHAGCYADVLKHFILSRLLSYMTQKDKPLFYLETHGGRGRYDLNDKMSKKTGEADFGIQKLWPNIYFLGSNVWYIPRRKR
jgi:23S rRNA (adenine2030-N6)-methyltransferase